MPNKNNNSKNAAGRPGSNAEENPKKERSNKRNMEASTLKQDQGKSMEEIGSRRGYYSRNGSYNGYSGL